MDYGMTTADAIASIEEFIADTKEQLAFGTISKSQCDYDVREANRQLAPLKAKAKFMSEMVTGAPVKGWDTFYVGGLGHGQRGNH